MMIIFVFLEIHLGYIIVHNEIMNTRRNCISHWVRVLYMAINNITKYKKPQSKILSDIYLAGYRRPFPSYNQIVNITVSAVEWSV